MVWKGNFRVQKFKAEVVLNYDGFQHMATPIVNLGKMEVKDIGIGWVKKHYSTNVIRVICMDIKKSFIW